MSFLFLFLSLLFYSYPSKACDDICAPLSQVVISQKGAERLFELILNNTFDSIQNRVEKVATFKDFNIDKSDCPKIKLYQAITRKEKCIGTIDFRKYKNDTPDADAELTGYKAQLTQLNLDKLGMNLVTPVKCDNWNCQFKVKVKDIKISGKLDARYSDTNKEIIPTTSLSVSSNQDAALYYDINLQIDPKSGAIRKIESQPQDKSLNNLVHVVPKSSQFSIANADLNFRMDFPKNQKTVSKEETYRASYLNFKELLSDEKWVLEQYQKMKMDPINPYRKSEFMTLSKEEVLAKIRMANQNWSVNKNYEQAFDAIPRDILSFVNAASEQRLIAESKYQAARNGISDFAAYTTLKNLEGIANKALADQSFLSTTLVPYLNQEVGAAVEAEVEDTLRGASQYWDMISKVPLDNGEEVAMDTEFIIQELDRTQNLIKMNLFDKKDNCFKNPAVFTEANSDKNANYDMQTTFSMSSLNKFFAKAVADKKLKFCTGDAKINCRDGVQVDIKTPPKISCEKGKLLLDFQNNEVRPLNLFGAKSQSLIEAEVANCDGSPCMKLKNLKSQFISLPFDSALNKGINSHLAEKNKDPIKVPHFNLNQVKVDPNCQASFDWNISP